MVGNDFLDKLCVAADKQIRNHAIFNKLFFAYQVSHTANAKTQWPIYPKSFDYLLVFIEQQRKRNIELFFESLMSTFTLRADANYLDTHINNIFVHITNAACFRRTKWRKVSRIEIQNQRFACQQVIKSDLFAIFVRELKIRRRITDF